MNRQIAIRGQDAGSLAEAPERLAFWLFGPLRMTVGAQPQEIGPGRGQRLLVALLDARGLAVTRGRLTEVVWDDQPEGASDELNKLVLGLRRRLAVAGADGLLTTGNQAYQLDVRPEQVDVHRFHALTERARGLDGGQQVVLLEQALALHRGDPLAGLRGRWIDGYRHRLLEERHAAELALYEAAIKDGQAGERIPGLHMLLQERPADEWVAWLCMHALYRAGRQSDALDVWHAVSRHLGETIAADSRRALTDLYERILRQDDELLRPDAVEFPAGGRGGTGGTGARVRALGRPDPRAGHDGEQADRPDDADEARDEADDARGAGQRQSRRHAAGGHASMVFNGSVIMHGGVIGNQIDNQYGPR
jgi:DNA-binding SARP family transcriptional activator